MLAASWTLDDFLYIISTNFHHHSENHHGLESVYMHVQALERCRAKQGFGRIWLSGRRVVAGSLIALELRHSR